MSRKDVVIVASVSCIYGLGNPEEYGNVVVKLAVGEIFRRNALLRLLIESQYQRNDLELRPGVFRVRGDTMEVFPAYEEKRAYRVIFFGDEVEKIVEFSPLTGEIFSEPRNIEIYPAKHYIASEARLKQAILDIEQEVEDQIKYFKANDRLLEAQRIEQRCRYDLEMLKEVGSCAGIENYSRHLAGRQLLGVLVDVRRVDREQRLVVLERVDPAGLPPCRRLLQAARPRRNRALLVAARLGAERRQRLAERRRLRHADGSRWGEYVKGSDGLLVEASPPSPSTDTPSLSIRGLVEIKSMPKSENKLIAQLERHAQRLQGGVMLAGKQWEPAQVTCPAPIFIMVVPSTWKISRAWQREDTADGWRQIFPDPIEPPVMTAFKEIQPDRWMITLAWSKEALEQAAYEMTFWYMSQVGQVIYSKKPIPQEWQGMSPEEAGYNAIKMMLYYVIYRRQYIHPRQGQQAVKLYNAYSYGYPLAVDAKDMLWPQDLVHAQEESGSTRP